MMNWIAWVILTALLAEYILNIIGDVLNIRHHDLMDKTLKSPDEEELHYKAKQYLRANTFLGWTEQTFCLLVLLLFWFLGGFQLLDQWVRSFDYGMVVTGMIYIAVLGFFNAALSLPFNLYDTFRLEARFGFNTTTIGTYIKDIVKTVIIAVIIGSPLLAGVLILFESAGHNAWLYCWIAVVFFMIFIQYIAPVWILPLFNQLKNLENNELRQAIMQYAQSVKFPLKNVFVMDGSKRSSKSNAFFTGFGKNKRIVLYDTLIEKHSIPELVSVLAHEIGHYKKKHIAIAMLISFARIGLTFYLLSICIYNQSLFDAFWVENQSIYGGFIFFGLLVLPLRFFIELITRYISRKNEYEADVFAVKTTGDTQSFMEALKKLSAHNLSNLNPHPFYVFLHYTHPPILDRISNINRINNKPTHS